MKNILLINAHQKYKISHGNYNKLLFQYIKDFFTKNNYIVQTTVIENGYIVEEEIENFLWADIIIMQFPIFWMSLPLKSQKYIDDIFTNAYGKFYLESENVEYGYNGLLNEKKYMLSTTWNAPIKAFNDKNSFFENKNVDDVLFNLHKIFNYTGMKKLETFSVHDIVKNPNIDSNIFELEQHLRKIFIDNNKQKTSLKYATTFGGSEFQENSSEYQQAIILGEWLAQNNYIVKCGGYYGLMEAVSKGVLNNSGQCIGVTNASFDPKKPNQYITNEFKQNDLFDRLRELIKDSELFVIQEGSLGTLTELSILWCLHYVEIKKDIRICLIGDSWKKVIDGLKYLPINDKEFKIIEVYNSIDQFCNDFSKVEKR